MKIKLTLKDYLRQLQLMNKQYAQEEALYPWIYMLLQMTKHKDVSIQLIRSVYKELHADRETGC